MGRRMGRRMGCRTGRPKNRIQTPFLLGGIMSLYLDTLLDSGRRADCAASDPPAPPDRGYRVRLQLAGGSSWSVCLQAADLGMAVRLAMLHADLRGHRPRCVREAVEIAP
jgi:hypothetical protein